MKYLTTILYFVGFSYFLFAFEEPIQLKGTIKDADTNEPIPFAHIIVENQVTISNLNGEFSISLEKAGEKPLTLEISYLGYHDHTQIIQNFDQYLEVRISAKTTALEEVTVKSGPLIMDRVFNNFHLNYHMEPLYMEGYYLESLRDSLGYHYFTEGIMDIYTPSNVNRYDVPWVFTKRSRKRVFKPTPESYVLAGNASDMAHFSIWRRDSFLGKRNRDNYEYFYDGTTKMGEHSAIIVEFEPKNKRGNATGRLYIDDITYAILKMEYHPNTLKSEFWDYAYWTEEYELIDGRFELVNVLYEGLADEKNKHYKAVLVVNDTRVEYSIPEGQVLLNSDDTFYETASNSDLSGEFWEGFHRIKLNDRVFYQIKSDNYGF